MIPAILIELSKLYFRQLNPEKVQVHEDAKPEIQFNPGLIAYQCPNCLTIYDTKFGDAVSQIPPGVPFNDLPDSYVCHVCGSTKKYFMAIQNI